MKNPIPVSPNSTFEVDVKRAQASRLHRDTSAGQHFVLLDPRHLRVTSQKYSSLVSSSGTCPSLPKNTGSSHSLGLLLSAIPFSLPVWLEHYEEQKWIPTSTKRPFAAVPVPHERQPSGPGISFTWKPLRLIHPSTQRAPDAHALRYSSSPSLSPESSVSVPSDNSDPMTSVCLSHK